VFVLIKHSSEISIFFLFQQPERFADGYFIKIVYQASAELTEKGIFKL
jgi:hypothetical protein